MLIYNELKNKPRELLTATGLQLKEFEKLLPAFQTAYEKKYPPELTQAGKPRQRQLGGGEGHCRRAKTSFSSFWFIRRPPPANDARLALWVESSTSQ